MRKLAALFGVSFLVCGALSAPASAQVIYEPVQYQHRTASGKTFYYGGSNPAVIEAAHRQLECVRHRDEFGERGFGYAVAVRGVIGEAPLHVYTDCLGPRQNAYMYGYTPTDARNQANASVPTYFRKADLIRAARLDADGRTLIVPAQGAAMRPYVDVQPKVAPAPATRPGTQPRPILIIPKKLLERPATPASDNTVAAVR